MNQTLGFRMTVPVFLACILMSTAVRGHEVVVHRKMVAAAAQAASNMARFLRENLGANATDPQTAPKFAGKTSFQWLEEGAELEDGLGKYSDPRYANHFYNPLTNGPLTDLTTFPTVLFGGPPAESRSWATLQGNGGVKGPNIWTWQGARAWQYNALIDISKASRDQAFAKMFRSLGQSTHLIADLSSPGHTRNDAHGNEALHNYIEEYGLRNVNNLNYPSEALDWKAAGFTKINDFWDHSLYFGTAAPLNNNQGTTRLGLAEFTHGNFLSEDAVYGELVENGNGLKHPFPSLVSSTNFSTLLTNPAAGYKTVTLRDGTVVTKLYLSKIADGIAVDSHAVVNSLGYLRTQGIWPRLPFGVTINDDKVLQEYHSILIPEGIKYVAGALDYFFRGKLDIRVTWDEGQSRYKLQITNGSSQQFKGGLFKLYSDDQNGNRTPMALNLLSPWNSGSTLGVGDSVQATFQAPAGNVAGYMLIYKGTIGDDGVGNSGDLTDADIAIASHEFKILRFNIKWDPVSDIDLYLTDPDGTIIWYGSKVSELGELDIDDNGGGAPPGGQGVGTGLGPENITLKTVIDGDYQVWANYYEDWVSGTQNNPPNPPTPITVTMKTYFNGSTAIDTSTFTLTQRNYGVDRPVGTVGPATQASWYVRKLVKVLDGKVTEH